MTDTAVKCVERGIAGTAAHLAYDDALRSIELDPYWPSPLPK